MASSNYTAYELSDGACLEDIEGICNHLTQDGSFNDETQPKLSDIERWITLSRHWLAGILASNGISPIQTTSEVVGILQELNALDVCVKIELSMPVTGIGEPNERFKALKERRDELLEMIQTSNMLEVLGAVTVEAGSLSQNLAATGISKSRKQSVEDNEDLVQSRFKRGMGTNPRAGDATQSDTDYYSREIL